MAMNNREEKQADSIETGSLAGDFVMALGRYQRGIESGTLDIKKIPELLGIYEANAEALGGGFRKLFDDLLKDTVDHLVHLQEIRDPAVLEEKMEERKAAITEQLGRDIPYVGEALETLRDRLKAAKMSSPGAFESAGWEAKAAEILPDYKPLKRSTERISTLLDLGE